MLVSTKLLQRYVNLDGISSLELAEALTNAGHEVEGISEIIEGTELVVGHVLECVDHPDSDHLKVCQVDIGKEVSQIVCGADNIAQGQTVIVAQVGSVLPGITIKETQIRGIDSNGMICSLNELGLAEKYQSETQKSGILVLSEGKPGDDPRVVLGFDDSILDVSQTANRSDFMSIWNVAREVSAIFNLPLNLPELGNHSDEIKKTSLEIKSYTDRSPLFLGKIINKLVIKDSPTWIRAALIASGIKPINNVVDISNLVMLETGQPLHFYDKISLNSMKLSVRDDIQGTYKALDDKEYKIQLGDLMIMNDQEPAGIAGIMGLGNTMVHDDTESIVIEVARFDAVSVRKTANRLGLSTDASVRFSKPMDNLSANEAMMRAVDLLIEYANADEFEALVTEGELNQTLLEISITSDKINRYLGTHLEENLIMDVFNKLNFKPVLKNERIVCTVPSYRKDLFIEEDLIEEVIRMVGYDILEETLPKMDLTMGDLNQNQKNIRLIESSLLGLGLDQINTYTLTSFENTEGLNAFGDAVALMSPMSEKRTHLRTYMFHSMLETLAYNNSHRVSDAFFFEHSNIYAEGKSTQRLAMIGAGSMFKTNWTKVEMPIDFFLLKGILINLLEKLGYSEKRISLIPLEEKETYLHPFKSAEIQINRKKLGYIGHVHPNNIKENDLKDAVYCEIDLDVLFALKSGSIKASSISKYPQVKRDLAVLVSNDIIVSDLEKVIEKVSRKFLMNINVFDIFKSEKLGNKKSVAFELTLGTNRTLSVEEINDIMKSVEKELTDKFEAEIR